MALNIKNERTTALVRELAERTGESQTRAVELAVTRHLADLEATGSTAARTATDKRNRSVELLRRLHAELSPEEKQAVRMAEAELYDDQGLPQ